jgi:hypothetical protein
MMDYKQIILLLRQQSGVDLHTKQQTHGRIARRIAIVKENVPVI